MALIYRRPTSELLERYARPRSALPRQPWTENDLPHVLTALREAAGLTRVGLGRQVGRSGQAVRCWETGRTQPPPLVRRRLERVLRLEPDSLTLRS
jgi:ribosome-binding protein aMBF1 (putative translation factor)